MFSSGPNYSKLKTNLRLAINRLKLLEKKKTELALKARKEIADYISSGKIERAKIRVEHIIREDYLVEAMEVTEMYCDLLLARFGLIQQMKDLDEGLAESISSLIWVAPRLQTDVAELKAISDQLTFKYGKPYAQACREQGVGTISEKLIHKLSVQAPPKILVEKYLMEIAKNYNIEYEPDPQIMRESEWGEDPLIKLNDPDSNDLGGNGGGATGGGGGVGELNIPPYPQVPQAQAPFDYPQKVLGSHNAQAVSLAPSIFLTNPQSLANCFEQFGETVKENDPDVVAVSETWFSPSQPAEKFQLNGYTMFNDDREERRGGGVALYIRTRLVPYSPDIKVPPELECIWAAIGPTFYICSLYNAPRATTGKLLLEHIINTVLDLRMRSPNVKFIIIGDFNKFPHERLYSSISLRNLVLEPTHQNSVIDLILTDVPHLYSDVKLLPPIGSSQHHCVLASPLKKIGFPDDFKLPNVPGQPYLPNGPPPPPDMSVDTMSNNLQPGSGGQVPYGSSSMPPSGGTQWDAFLNMDNSPPPPYSSSMDHLVQPPTSAPPNSIPPNIGTPKSGAHNFPPDLSNRKDSNQPKPAPRSKFEDDKSDFNLPELPNVPDAPGHESSGNTPPGGEDIDFDDLNRRFEELKKKK